MARSALAQWVQVPLYGAPYPKPSVVAVVKTTTTGSTVIGS
ncbi:MAG: hypothetical protein AB1451_01375 [Nitrospirota bacterium]